MTTKTTAKDTKVTDVQAKDEQGLITRIGTAIGGFFGRNAKKFKAAGYMAVGAGLVVGGQMAKARYDARKEEQKLLTAQ